MCSPLPFPRCSAHAKARVENWEAKLTIAEKGSADYAIASAKLQTAKGEYALTSAGLKELAARAASLPLGIEKELLEAEWAAHSEARKQRIVQAKALKNTAPRKCQTCSKPLSNRQMKFCSFECTRAGSKAPSVRLCASCGRRSDQVPFAKHSQTPDGLSTLCSECAALASKKRYDSLTPEERSKRRKKNSATREFQNSVLMRTYNISLFDYETMLEIQKGQCKLCHVPFGDRSEIKVDHNHSTGIVRGLLCNKCNIGLGRFKDSPAFLEAAIRYLKYSDITIKQLAPLLLHPGETRIDVRHDRRVRVSLLGKERILAHQGFRCAICDKRLELSSSPKPHLDHRHSDTQVRGMLCSTCNIGLGMFGEDVSIMKRAVSYLSV